ncbi:CaiB/BaiF CoA-transferase family protein [Salinibacterium sp. ZJ454]|uniref:CaiB/BaiF CoA transferase family protein n=1 Tax=Salinibacterium sp. ZJ454 TaxID=2708339 RepID=UPI002443A176|nr:CaiB/BaiF CoA-transferase family protein [Salinibacterium sp. ZJ454]
MGPLNGIRVVEIGHALAGPFAGVMLADFGADVIKIEQPGVGDSMRAMGPSLDDSSVWWSVTGRNKRSICIDYKKPEGLAVVHSLLEGADVLIENLRPGVMARAGLGWDELHARHPQLVMLSISGYGGGGPYSDRPGFGKIAEAFSGATHLTGSADAPPVHPGYSLADASSGLMGAFGIMVALRDRDNTGAGQHIDLALYEPLLRMIEWQVPLHELHGWTAKRLGAQFPFGGAFLTDICETADGSNVVISAATTKALNSVRSMLAGLGMDEAAAAPVEIMNEALRQWIRTKQREEVVEILRAHDVVAGPVYSPADIVADPHIKARGNIVTVEDSSGARIPMPGVVPQLGASPGSVRWAGPALGEHSDDVLREIGIEGEELARLRGEGVIS